MRHQKQSPRTKRREDTRRSARGNPGSSRARRGRAVEPRPTPEPDASGQRPGMNLGDDVSDEADDENLV